MVKSEKHIKEEKYMFTLTEEQKKKIEDSYNYYSKMYEKMEEPVDKNFYLGKSSGMDEVLSCLGYKTKIKWCVVREEEE